MARALAAFAQIKRSVINPVCFGAVSMWGRSFERTDYHTGTGALQDYFFSETITRKGNKSRQKHSGPQSLFGFQTGNISLDFLAVVVVEIQKFDAEPDAVFYVANARNGDYAVL